MREKIRNRETIQINENCVKNQDNCYELRNCMNYGTLGWPKGEIVSLRKRKRNDTFKYKIRNRKRKREIENDEVTNDRNNKFKKGY